jgi:hypothetical protein
MTASCQGTDSGYNRTVVVMTRFQYPWRGDQEAMNAVATMAKKKQASVRKPEPPPEPEPRRAVLQMKGTVEWKGWLDRLARHLRMPTSSVVDNALVEYAKARGFDEEAPER